MRSQRYLNFSPDFGSRHQKAVSRAKAQRAPRINSKLEIRNSKQIQMTKLGKKSDSVF
jgi:hypothetical protein